ncbi:MAG: GrpB family protein [Candidatus Pacearchaeota archaeon]|nr:GrpB family protein [Candidatus Pacearchaeota archaeon]
MKKVWIKYSFKKYNKDFPKWFNQEKKDLFQVFGKEQNQKTIIEHIGSTAVPGLGGKGIIDIAIFAPKGLLNQTKKKISNYCYEEWPVPKKRKFFSFARYYGSKDHPEKVFHSHITSDKNVFETMLIFRDYLITHPKIVKDYAKLKKKAAKSCKNDYRPYLKLKNPFIKSVIIKAKKEAK